jgi:hypothetical protein
MVGLVLAVLRWQQKRPSDPYATADLAIALQ